ncbi:MULTISPECIES: cyclic nucleotide-gated ion channel [Rhodopseudomonas]|uniref:Cyclic nucleotide-binding protein n=1 Tax=Rhodopseudomonas palustris TaxID=1076 RepID=A0A0D7EJA5_RHOPL|nr:MULTISPECIES: cyclic nucleotide-gated ion channel [Rhodopseudomonas]KIZ39587.1 cyclic nucleotide-binding protein [Rhodopseudomonas palustris]MDF3813840.1 cyclic nucleotide-gated ion channel [Rhodopseudomonas sp. BAL398]WOK15432.1 cyclic nucleotide-gated ion channel [Rhodopseudomonas sp. BAL398]
MRDERPLHARARQQSYEILESHAQSTRVGLVVNRFIIFLIVFSIGLTVLESVPQLRAEYGLLFRALELFCLVVFSVEYYVRIWIAPENLLYRQLKPSAARRAYLFSPQGIIDCLAVMPLWVALLGYDDLRVLIIMRMLRVLKFARYSSGMRSLLDVLESERRALGACLVILLCATLLSATAMHIAEAQIQPDKFGTIPDAMWWAIVTLTTVGYGDVVPATGIGRMIASATIVVGLVMIALPVGIVANAFSEVIHRRDFIVNWSMVARVPLFSHLTAGDIAHIMQLLQARQIDRGDVIFRRGEPATAMYFIAEGDVEIELGPEAKGRRVRLGSGHFFGEIAVLKRVERSATVRAVSRVRLLVLDAADLRVLINREPSIAAKINKIVQGRTGGSIDLAIADIEGQEEVAREPV